ASSASSVRARTAALAAFCARTAGAQRVLVTSMGVIGTGVNLTAVSRMVVVDPGIAAAEMDQLTARMYRIGQARADLHVYLLCLTGSVDDRIMDVMLRLRAARAAHSICDPSAADLAYIAYGE